MVAACDESAVCLRNWPRTFRPAVESLLQPSGRASRTWGLSPNQVRCTGVPAFSKTAASECSSVDLETTKVTLPCETPERRPPASQAVCRVYARTNIQRS